MEYRLDLTAYRCPLPLMMTKKALSELQQGDSLLLILAADAAINDLAQLCQKLGYSFRTYFVNQQLCAEILLSSA